MSIINVKFVMLKMFYHYIFTTRKIYWTYHH